MSAAEKLANEHNDLLTQFKEHEHFCKVMLDGFAVIDTSGHVVKSNPLFAQMVGLTSKQIIKAPSLMDMLTLTLGEKNLTVADLLPTDGPTRIDEVRGKTAVKSDLTLIVGIYPFKDESGAILGSFLLLRDVTAETNLQGKYVSKSDQAIRDPLTGLYNRNHLAEYLRDQKKINVLEGRNPTEKTLCFLMLDIDFFKKVNDVYGHAAGDYVIKTVSQLILQTFRKTDVCFRVGGEEFLVILPGTGVEGAAAAAEKVRVSVMSQVFMFEGKQIPITISSGVAESAPDTTDHDKTIAKADEALYYSKHNGRNKVSIVKDGVIS